MALLPKSSAKFLKKVALFKFNNSNCSANSAANLVSPDSIIASLIFLLIFLLNCFKAPIDVAFSVVSNKTLTAFFKVTASFKVKSFFFCNCLKPSLTSFSFLPVL